MRRTHADARDLVVDVIMRLVRDALDGDAEAIQLLRDEWAPVIDALGIADVETVQRWCKAPQGPQDDPVTLDEMAAMIGVPKSTVRNYVQGIHRHDPTRNSHYIDGLEFPARQRGLRGKEAMNGLAVPRVYAEWFARGFAHGEYKR